MRSRHLAAMDTLNQRRLRRLFWIFALVLLGLASAAFARDEADPPARVAALSYRQGGVVFAPQGEDEWTELPANRPITVGDRLWSDRGARAELQLGSATMQVAGESQLGVSALDERAAQFLLQQGSVNLRVRELAPGENVEIGTPNLAFRAMQPGEYRIDVDAQSGETNVVVRSGRATVYGEGGQEVNLGAGQQASFAGRFLAPVQAPQFVEDDFGLWAAERNRLEDQSIAARHVPRGVVGYPQLDQHGTWGQDPNYGEVWYPQVTVQDWAPYRYGHWSWISPWGWTWIDDAPWGFAPFHYGRWIMIGSRWAWVPGRLAVRPVYSPALVVFLGGGGTRIAIHSSPAVGWYPLAPGEAWWPTYQTTPHYVSHANYDINLNAYPRHYDNHFWRHRTNAVTAVAEDSFRRGLPVYRNWERLPAPVIGQAQIGVVPQRPDPRRHREFAATPQLQAAPPTELQPVTMPRFWGGRAVPQAVREQQRAEHEQHRLQRDAERSAREQQRAAELARQQQDVQVQREQMLRQQQERAVRIGAQRQQQEQSATFQRGRAQHDAWRQQREQQHVRPVEQPRAALPQQVQVPQQQVQAAQQPQQAVPIGRGRGGDHERREERGGEDRGWQGHGRWNR